MSDLKTMDHGETLSSTEARVLGTILGDVRNDVSGMREDLRAITTTLQTLAKLEVQHQETRGALDRCFTAQDKLSTRIDGVDDRLQKMEIVMPGLRETRTWIVGLVIGCVGLVFLALAAVVMRPPTVMQPYEIRSPQQQQQR